MVQKIGQSSLKAVDILLYIPNIIGYVRIFLLLLAFLCMCMERAGIFVVLYSISIVLDFFDGWAARKFNQTSAYGAWWGWLLVSIEWITFVGNHQAGSKWREAHAKANPKSQINPPEFVLKIMANGFKTWRGAWVIAGLHVLPVWIYAVSTGVAQLFLPNFINYLVIIILTIGRIQCLACELWCIQKHVRELLEEDLPDKK